MPKISRSYLLLSLCLILVSVSSGCATVSVATAGTIAGIAASSISTGAEVYRLGKLDAVEMDTFEDATAAVRLAASDLELKIVEEKKKKGKDDWSFELSDDVKNTLSVRVQQRTDRLAAIRVDVGIFGSEPTGPAAPPTVSEINAAKMQNAVVPQAVQNAFARDYPGAAINTIEMQSTSAGDSFYKIVFIRDGKPGAAQYFATGAPFPK